MCIYIYIYIYIHTHTRVYIVILYTYTIHIRMWTYGARYNTWGRERNTKTSVVARACMRPFPYSIFVAPKDSRVSTSSEQQLNIALKTPGYRLLIRDSCRLSTEVSGILNRKTAVPTSGVTGPTCKTCFGCSNRSIPSDKASQDRGRPRRALVVPKGGRARVPSLVTAITRNTAGQSKTAPLVKDPTASGSKASVRNAGLLT